MKKGLIIGSIILFIAACVGAFIFLNRPTNSIDIKFKEGKTYTKEFNLSNVEKDSSIIFDYKSGNLDNGYLTYKLYQQKNDKYKVIKRGYIHEEESLILDKAKEGKYKIKLMFYSSIQDKASIAGEFKTKVFEKKEKVYFDYRAGKVFESVAGSKDNIKRIKIEPINDKYDKNNIISTSDSKLPAYARFEKGTLYLGTDGELTVDDWKHSLFGYLTNLEDASDLKYINMSQDAGISGMFQEDKKLTNIDFITYWDTSKIANMMATFSGCSSLTNIDALINIDTSNNKYFSSFLKYTNVENINSLKNFNTKNVIDMSSMFEATNIKNINSLSKFNTKNVESFDSMFKGTNIKSVKALEKWNTSSIKTISFMFEGAPVEDFSPIANWDMENLEKMISTFAGTKIKNLDFLSNWNTKKLKDISYAFHFCRNLEDINGLANLKTSNLEKMAATFNSTKINNLDALKDFDVSNVVDMSSTFRNCRSLKNIDGIKNWNTKNVTTMESMFTYDKITNIEALRNFDVSNVENFKAMFYSTKITSVEPISNWNVSKSKTFYNMFYFDNLVDKDKLNNWVISPEANVTDMFYSEVGGDN